MRYSCSCKICQRNRERSRSLAQLRPGLAVSMGCQERRGWGTCLAVIPPRCEQRSRIKTRSSGRAAAGNISLHLSYSQTHAANKPCRQQPGIELIDNIVAQLLCENLLSSCNLIMHCKFNYASCLNHNWVGVSGELTFGDCTNVSIFKRRYFKSKIQV